MRKYWLVTAITDGQGGGSSDPSSRHSAFALFDAKQDAIEYAEKHVHEYGQLYLLETIRKVGVARAWEIE